MELVSLQLVPEPFGSLDQAINLMGKEVDGTFKFKVPDGKYVLFALVKIRGFLEVINGAPGATGPVLNHFNKPAVQKYLNNMSDKIQNRLGPVSGNIRSLFTDSMELEGSNWSYDMAEEFKHRLVLQQTFWMPLHADNEGKFWIFYCFRYSVGRYRR